MDIVREFTPAHLAYWSDFDCRVTRFGAPEDSVGVEPALAIVTAPVAKADLGMVVRVGWRPNEVDLAHLARGGTIWLSTWGGLPMHRLEVQPPAVAS